MLLYKIRRHVVAFILSANSISILVGTLLYILLAYSLLQLAGETELLAPDTFLYWLIVTASTVGYGDLSPQTGEGRLITALFIIPVGLSLFAICIGKIGYYLSETIQKGKKGLRMTRADQHCIIIGWNGARTLRLINLLLTKQNSPQEKIVLCHDQAMENPLPSKVEFVHVVGYTDIDSMKRAAIERASRIIIDSQQDDITLATALFCQQQNKHAHVTVYFKDENHSELVKSYCPSVEVVPSVSVEMLARASVDPGSASLHQNLLDPNIDASSFSTEYKNNKSCNFGELFSNFRVQHQAIAIAVKKTNDADADINPPDTMTIAQGDIIYYIADKRIPNH